MIKLKFSLFLILFLALTFLLGTWHAQKAWASGGPDSFGYTSKGSNEVGGPTYAFEDASSGGTDITASLSDLDDGNTDAQALGFSVDFYGNTYTQVYVGSNGLLTFGAGSSDGGNASMPNAAAPNNVIAPFWDDIDFSDAVGAIYTKQLSSPNRFVVEWQGVHLFGAADLSTFEAVIYENGDILFQYQTLTGTIDSVTVGIENSSGSVGLQYLYNQNGLTNSLAVKFYHPLKLVLGPATQANIVAPGSVISHPITITHPFGGNDSFNLTVSGNSWPTAFYDGDTQVTNTGTMADHDIKNITVKVTVPATALRGSTDVASIAATLASDPTVTSTITTHSRVPGAAVLLVDGDNGATTGQQVESYYENALTANSYSYDYWDKGTYGSPSLAMLQQYSAVLWFTGLAGGRAEGGSAVAISAADETALGSYLDGGGKFFLSNQDYVTNNGLNAFGQNYLHIGSGTSDYESSATSETGQADSPVGNGLGTLALNNFFATWTDRVTTDGQSAAVFINDLGHITALSYTDSTFATVFFAFPFESLSGTTARNTVMSRIITFLGVDATAPTIPGTPSTTSPNTSGKPAWSFTASTDSGGGLATTPYTVQWSTDSSFASGVNSSTSNTNSFTHTDTLANGTWYFRVRAADVAGNSSSFSANGSVVVAVDTTPPSGPTSVSSTSHTTSTYSSDNTIDVSWTAATDAGSGLSGYSYVFDTTSNTVPAATQNLGLVTTVTSGALSGGITHYFHIRPVDALGNWGTTVHLGPFYIDTSAPTNQNTVFTTSITKAGGASVTIASSGDATNNVWFAPPATSSFSAGGTMTTVAGNATSILAPADAGTYKLFVLDAAGNISAASTAGLLVSPDTYAPSVDTFTPATLFTNGSFSLPEGTTDQTNTSAVVVNSDVTLSVTAALGGTSSVTLPSGTTITKSGGGTIDATTLASSDVATSALSGLTSGTVVYGALQWGIPDLGLEFDTPITLNIYVGTDLNGQTLSVVRSISISSGWTDTGIVAPATCVVASGICTFQATKASYYATTHTTSSSSSSSSSSGSSTSSSTSVPGCGDTQPSSAPNLFQIDTAGTYVNLYFAKVSDNITGYNVSFGTTKDANQHADAFSYSGPLWIIGRTISSLSPNTTYYFKIQATNGCTAGPWSKTMQIKTKGLLSNITQFFANLSPFKATPQPKTNKAAVTTASCEVTVRGGDTLWNISSSSLGSGKRYGEIVEFNKTIYPEILQKTLRPGWKLKVC